MQEVILEEIEVVSDLKKHTRLMRKSSDPKIGLAAAKWEIFLDEKLIELEQQRAAAEHAEAA